MEGEITLRPSFSSSSFLALPAMAPPSITTPLLSRNPFGFVQIEKEDNHILSVAPAQCVYSKWGTFCTLLTQIGAIKLIRRSTQILYGIPKINFIYNGKQLSVLSALHRFFDFSAVTGECPTGVSIISNDKVTSLIR